jgi:MoaA/NifB/PqqE/SkfB family radical SAM enzyme
MSRARSILQTEDQICCYRSITSAGTRVLWEITSACNLRCDFCLVEIKQTQLSLERALAIADALVARRVDKVLLSGGEPLVFKGIEQAIGRLVEGGVLVKLLTNGTVANETVFRMIEADPTFEVSLSILSVRPEKADRIFRRPGAWSRLCATLDRLPSRQVNIITACNTENEDEIEEIIDWVAARGIPGISVINVFKDPSSPARFRDDCRDYRIPDAHIERLRSRVASKRAEYEGRLVIRTTQFWGCGGETCGAGRSVLYIDALGRLLPCTLTDNRVWRERTAGLDIGAAMDLYARELPELPASSCVPLLERSRLTEAMPP